jgi:hypothetical protein
MRWVFSPTAFKSLISVEVEDKEKADKEIGTCQNGSAIPVIIEEEEEESGSLPPKYHSQLAQRTSQKVQQVHAQVQKIRKEVENVQRKVDHVSVQVEQVNKHLGMNLKHYPRRLSYALALQDKRSEQGSSPHPEKIKEEEEELETEDEADSIRSSCCSSSSCSTSSIRKEALSDDVDSGLEMKEGMNNEMFDKVNKISVIVEDKWRKLFDKYDREGFGEILWPDFFVALRSEDFKREVPEGKLQLLRHLGTVYSLHTSAITFQCFVNIVSKNSCV